MKYLFIFSIDLLNKLKSTPNSGSGDTSPGSDEGVHQRKRANSGSRNAKPEPVEPEYNNEQLEIVKKIKK